MISRTSPSCVKCGRPVPGGAGFCPNCGTQIGDAAFLPAGDSPGEGATIGPTAVVTSLDNPTPSVRRGDGPFLAGQQIGTRYTILKLLGTGGMGAVYQAFDHELGVAVAIKVIRPGAQSDATVAKELETRFKRELVLARQVTHKYVVRIHDLGEIDGIKYLTMPFVEGDTLSQLLRQSGSLPLDRVIKISQQVAQGLAAAHDKGVVHRDLKPENIMIEKAVEGPVPASGDALIMDFGIARSVDGGATQTAVGSVIGTLEYMAPEQAKGQKVDQRADQYALGLIMYDMLVGRQRLANRENAMSELIARMSAAPPPPRSIKPEIPEPVDRIVARLLDPNPANRYGSTQELVTALDHLTPDGHTRSDVHEIIVHDVAPGRPKWQLAAAAALIVAVAGTAGWILSNRNAPPPEAGARAPISVLIGDFENRTGDPVFDGVVEQALSLGIEGASFVSSFPRRDALRAAAAIKPGARLDEQTAKLVALRENLGMVIVGAIEPKGSGYHITVKGLGPGNDAEVKYTLEDDAPAKSDVLRVVGDLAGLVRKALGDTVAPAAGDAFTAASLEAAREYVRAQELLAAGKAAEAIPAYLSAAKLDPDFGRAWSGAATAAGNLGLRDDADRYFQEALAKIDRMTERERLRTRGQYYLFARNAAKGVEENAALVARYPSDGVGLGNLALAHFQLRQFDKATEIATRASALNPNNLPRLNNLAMYAMYAGRFEDAIAGARKATEINKVYGPGWLAQGLSLAALGNYDEAAAAYAALAPLSGGKVSAAHGMADIALLRGRTADAGSALEALLADKLAPQQLARVNTTLAGVRLSQGRTADAVKLAEGALSATQDAIIRFEAGRIFLAADRAPRAKQVAAELAKSLLPETQALGLTLTGEIELAGGNERAAIQTFQQALKLADAWQTHYLLGRAYLRAEAFTEADSEFDACLRRQGEATAVYLDDVPTWRTIAPVYYYQGVARHALKRASAAESFRAFVAFKDGGDEQNALVADARKRLAQ
jgi:tetratricopeptide (TPR) repeat protein/tRNA A-37 threonylcarbamoyl transferase component Bud32